MPKIISTASPIVPPVQGEEVGYECKIIELLAIGEDGQHYYSLPDGVELGEQEVTYLSGEEITTAKKTIKFTETESERQINQKISEVKAEAKHRIQLIAPKWKQMNSTARALELTGKVAVSGKGLTPDELDELGKVNAGWNFIKLIRVRSNVLEDWINDPVRTASELEDLSVSDDIHWI